MTRKEKQEIYEEQLYLYSGILFHNQEFAEGNKERIIYDFSCPEYVQLREKYELERIAGKGSDFVRAKRLLHYLAPRLTHCSWYDGHVACNALDLLEYSLNKPEQGINCLYKSKILEECCLALGIGARRVSILPYSPYDFDNHVVTEIFDRDREKWIMLDATTDGYFVDENKVPMSLLEMRERFANDRFVTFVKTTDKLKNLESTREKNLDMNAYICKNLFCFLIDQYCGFGKKGERLFFAPKNYSDKNGKIANLRFRIHHVPDEHKEFIPQWEEYLTELEQEAETVATDINRMACSPAESDRKRERKQSNENPDRQ